MKKIEKTLEQFNPLTLTELNASASFLRRIDRKFLLNVDNFGEFLDELKNKFLILEIAGKNIFHYDNIYMDSEDYLLYNQHQNKSEKRSKVRTRYYKEADMAFFEFKQKQNGITSKYRYEFPSDEHGTMTKGKTRFFEGVWQSMYNGDPKAPKLSPSIQTTYKRITLVDVILGERLTIDFDISTLDLRNKKAKAQPLKNLVIVESKSLDSECYSVNLLKKHGHVQAKACSKYALGLIQAKAVKKTSHFEETLKQIKKITK